ncbi:hypothetical protein ABTM42_20630, partial [Acinetobacter baumannii]
MANPTGIAKPNVPAVTACGVNELGAAAAALWKAVQIPAPKPCTTPGNSAEATSRVRAPES